MIVAIAWTAAAVVAILVIGFCGYELTWKAARLRTDLARLQSILAESDRLRAQLITAQQHVQTRPPGR